MDKDIIIEGKESDWYEKAIFVLKDQRKEQVPRNLAVYAEDILEKKLKTGDYIAVSACINDYAVNNKQVAKQSGVSKFAWIDDFFGVSLGILGMMVVFYFLF